MATDLAQRAWASIRTLAVAAFVAVLAAPASAVDVTNLLDSGAGSLRNAIASTADGGTINFTGGATFGTITLTTGEIAFAKSLTLVGPGASSVTVSGNNAARIFNLTDSSKTFAISGLTLQNAAAIGQGGAIATNGALVVDSVQFSSNQASDGGGAIFIGRTVLADLGTAIIKNSSFSANRVSGASGAGGGAILLTGAPGFSAALTMVNSTVSGNVANASIGMPGGGISFSSATVVLISSTIAFNHAGAAGADLHQGSVAGSSLTLRNSIVSDGTIDASPIVASDRDIYQPGGATINSLGFNIVQRRSAATGYQASDAPDGTNPQLAALANNGGPTLTHALIAGSPALDFVPTVQCVDESSQPLLRDQRGPAFVRQSAGNLCDAGAFEAQVADLTISKTHVGNFAQGQAGASYTITVSNVGPAATSGTVTVVDTLPPSLGATALSGTGWTCTLGTLTCTRGDPLAGGASYLPIILTVNVAGNAPASVTNVATVAGGGELNTTNDAASDPTTIVPGPDLTIAKTHVGNFVQGQSGAAYTITVHNSGAGATSGSVSVVDILPASMTATGLSGTGWTCTLGTMTCTRSDVLAGGLSYPVITLTVNVANNAPASVTNTATTSGGGDVNPGNNTANDPTNITQVADLTITKSHVGNLIQGQLGSTYMIAVSNAGPGPTSGTVTVVDALPAGLTATALVGTGWTCTLATLTCTRSDVLANGGSYPPLTLTVNVASNAPASITNIATVSGGGELNTGNDTASDVTTIAAGPDLTVTKTHSGNFTQGQSGAAYTITVHNGGGSPTSATVTMVDTLPAGLAATGLSGTGWACTLATLTCTRGDALAAGADYPTITLTVNVASSASASVTNTATVSGGGDVVAGNNVASDPTTIIQVADLTITKSHVGNLAQGQIGAMYTITVSNAGPGPTSGTVTLVDTLPAGLTATALAGTGWSCTLATLTCTRVDVLASGSSYPALILTVNVANNTPASVTNVAMVSGGGELNAGNDTASDVTTIAAGPDLTITKTHGGNFAQGQTGAIYTITVTNSGSTATTGAVSVVDTLPASLTATGLSGTGWTCTLGTLTCTRGDVLANGTSYPALTLTVNVANNAPASLTNTATVSGGGDVNGGNNTASDPTTITLAADLTITKSHIGNPIQGQTGVTYTITVSNAGPGPTSGPVTVVDTLPAGLTATALAGTGWACNVASLTCTRSDALANGASYPALTLTVAVGANAPASVTNMASVSGGGEINTANDTASDPTTIVPAADLSIAKTHSGSFKAGSIGATYTIVASNVGLGPTVGTVTVVDTLPPQLVATAIAGAGWTCNLATLTCTRSDVLAAGSTYPPITVTVNVSSTATGAIVNSVAVSGGGDVSPANGTASDSASLEIVVVPTLSTWLVAALAAALAIAGGLALRRRNG
jgi:uncharacterized repeat protein (TIGR01451 family)